MRAGRGAKTPTAKLPIKLKSQTPGRRPAKITIVFAAAALVLCARAANFPILNDRAAGEKLASRLANAMPEEGSEIRGVFEMERRGAEDSYVPVTMKLTATNDSWQVIYAARTNHSTESVTIVHGAGKPTAYSYQAPEREAVSLSGDRATNNFAGSDFALADLGLEFLHWPTQVLVTKEMKKSRGCYVLESRPAATNLYSRVVSWLDEETSDRGAPGLVLAHAYDAQGRLLKEFEVREFKKVGGQWQVQEIELRNRQTKGSTRLRFDFNSK